MLSVADAAAEADVIMILLPDTEQAAVYEAEIAPHLQPGRRPLLRPRLQHPVRPDQPAGRRRRGDGRAEGPGPPGAAHLHRGRGRAVARRGGCRSLGQGPRPGPLLRPCHRCDPRRCARHHLRRGDRDRSLRRAGGALRWAHRAGAGRLRDAGGRGVPARVGLLRVPPRAQAHRRPHVRAGDRRACASRSPTPPSTAT